MNSRLLKWIEAQKIKTHSHHQIHLTLHLLAHLVCMPPHIAYVLLHDLLLFLPQDLPAHIQDLPSFRVDHHCSSGSCNPLSSHPHTLDDTSQP